MMISIISPCYNAEKYLLNTFESVTAQTHMDWEWLIVDDSSSDRSWEILESLAQRDSRIKIFKNSTNSGPSYSRNRGLDEVHGEFVAFLDIDDLWEPNKLERQLQFMTQNQYDFSCHDYQIMSESGEALKEVKIPSTVSFKDIQSYNPLATSFIMIKQSVIGELRYDLSLRRRQDWVFWYYLLKKIDRCYGLNEVLGNYRKDSAHSISKNKAHMAFIQWHLYRSYFKFGVLKSVICFLKYAQYGIKKHFFS